MKKLLVLPAIALSLIGTGTAAASVPETHMNKTPEVTEIQLGNGDDSIIMYSSSILLGVKQSPLIMALGPVIFGINLTMTLHFGFKTQGQVLYAINL